MIDWTIAALCGFNLGWMVRDCLQAYWDAKARWAKQATP